MITFWVPGHPKTKGSMTAQHGGRRLVQSVEGSERWAALVTQSARGRGRVESGPVSVNLAFWLPVPDVAAGRPGDIDKLARNVLDALTKAGTYGDDVQVVQLLAVKYPAGEGAPMGCLVSVDPIPETLRAPLWRKLLDFFVGLAQQTRRDQGLQT